MARRLAWAVLLIGLVSVCLYARLAHLSDNPGWDQDEGYNWSIASNLADGRAQMFALRYAFVQHPPFFYLLGAAMMRLWSHDLLVLRTLSALCGLGTAVALLGLGCRLGGKQLGLPAALIYLVWPQAVLQARWAYTYNLLALLVVAALWAALPARTKPASNAAGDDTATVSGAGAGRDGLRGALLAGALAGLAMATDQEALPLLLAVGLLLLEIGPRQAVAGVLAALLPPAIYLGWMLAARPGDLLFDIGHTATRLGGGSMPQQAADLLGRLLHLLWFDPLLAIGLLGLLLLPRGRPRRIILLLAALSVAVILKVRDPNPLFRAAEPLLPLAALGLGRLLGLFASFMDALFPSPGVAPGRRAALGRRALVASAVVALPLGASMLGADLGGARAAFKPAIAAYLPRSTAEARRMAGWINGHSTAGDLTIAMPAVAWLLHCRTAEVLQAVAITGHGAAFYPDGLARDRFVYDSHLEAARYIVVDDFTRSWIAGPQMFRERALVDEAQRRWRMVYKHAEYTIYANPRWWR